MMHWFKWNGINCTEFGMYVTELPPVTIPAERTTFTNVPGKSGSLTTLEAEDVYDDMILTATCILRDPARIPEIAAWLKGSGTVTFANRDGGYYYARIVNQIPFEKLLRGNPHRTFAVNFRCKPFWYVQNPETLTLMSSTSALINPGSVASEPIITVTGSGEITLMINGSIIELSEITDSITLDTPLMEAYNGTTSMNHCMSGDFPVLQPGPNAISWSGDVSSVQVQTNWRYL